MKIELVVLKGKWSSQQHTLLSAIEVEFLEYRVQLVRTELNQQISSLRVFFEFGWDHHCYNLKAAK